MRLIVTVAALATIALAAAPRTATAQMRAYDQGMQRMQSKLPTTTFDGTTLKITTYPRLLKVASFLRNYGRNLGSTVKAWKAMKAGRNSARLKALKANRDYYNALVAAYKAKAAVIKAPVKAKPKSIRRIAMSELYIGPGAGSDKPILIDTVGARQTLFRAWASPGSKSKPSRWSAKLEFFVKYKNMATDDAVFIQVKKGRRRLGSPTACRAYSVMADLQLGYFKCKSPLKRNWAKMHKTAGAHTIELTYKKPIEGKVFKKFAVLHVNVIKLKQGAANNPYVSWSESHDMNLHVTTIEEKLSQSHSGGVADAKRSAQAGLRFSGTRMYLRTWFKYKKNVPRSKVTCLYKGKRVSEGRAVSSRNYSYWSYLRKGSRKRDEAKWTQQTYDLGLLIPRPFQGKRFGWSRPPHFLSDHLGAYRCVITGGGEILKEVFFTVGAEGEIVKPRCQLKSMNTLRHITLVKATNKKVSDRSWNKKVGRRRGFEGRVKWARGCPL